MIRWRVIRLRLTAWHAGAMALVLAVFAAGTWIWLERTAERRVDRSLAETVGAFESLWLHELAELGSDGATGDRRRSASELAAIGAAAEFRYHDRGVLVLDGERLVGASASDSAAGAAALPSPPALRAALPAALPGPGGAPLATTVRVGGAALRVRAEPARIAGVDYAIVAVESLARERATRRALAIAMLVAIPLALLLSIAGGWLLAGASLAPAVAMDERQREFMAEASHELRTPVAVVRATSDVALSRPDRAAGELRDALDLVHRESLRLSRIVEDLFLMARADAGRQPVRVAELYLDELVADSVRAARVLAEPRRVALELAPTAETPLRGDEALLGRLVMNLLENAIRHTPAGGRVQVALSAGDGSRRIEVRDGGAGVPPEAQRRIFDRFYRGEPAAGEDSVRSGAGLGLPIARWIAEAHGGSLVLAESGPSGSRFVATLPREGPRAEPPRA